MGCIRRDTIDVKYKPLPVVHIGNDTTLCANQILWLNANNNNATYLWQDGSTTQEFLVQRAGSYFVAVDLNNCTTSDTIEVSYIPLPYFNLGKDSFLCSGNQYILTPLLNTGANLLWQDGSTAASYTVVKGGIYFLTATNVCGSFTDSVTITMGYCDIMMPTGFTPNGDGLNDLFMIKYPFPVKQFDMVVYDRWGEKVFEANNMTIGWDGTWKGLPQPQGTYVWIINYTDMNNNAQQLKGSITLLR
jgi:gliding motility-associated-like protein